MKSVNVYQAKNQLSRLVSEAVDGQEIVIAKNGRPLVRLTRIENNDRPLGLAQGIFAVPDDFDEPLPASVIESFNA